MVNINEKKIIDAISADVAKLLEQNHWHTYEGFINYDKGMGLICEKYIAEIFTKLYKQIFVNKKEGVSIPFVAFYLHSEVLKGRIAVPVYLDLPRNARFKKFFKVYKNNLNKVKAKRVLIPEVRRVKTAGKETDINRYDHLLGLMLERDFNDNDNKLPIVVRVLKHGTENRDSRFFNTPHKDTRFLTASPEGSDEYNDYFDKELGRCNKWVKNFINNKLSFILEQAAISKPIAILGDSDYQFPTNRWAAVSYLYFPEIIRYGHASGCVVCLVEENEIDQAELSQRISVFASTARNLISHCVTSTITRLECEAITTKPSLKNPVIYPENYATQDLSKPFSQMPLLTMLEEIGQAPHVKDENGKSVISHAIEVLSYLVNTNKVRTTGYDVISSQILEAVISTYSDITGKERSKVKETPLIKVLRNALNFENDLSGIDGYREHFIHSFHVFCTGVCILNFLYINKVGVFNDKKRGQSFRRILKMFFFAAMWHDISYSVEKMERLADRYLNNILDEKISIPMQPHFGHLLIGDKISSILSEKNEVLSSSVLDSLIGTKNQTLVIKACRKQLITKAHHGVLSAVVFDDLRGKVKIAGFGNDEYASILLSMMLHHCLDFFKEEDSEKGKRGTTKPKHNNDDYYQPWKLNPWSKHAIVPTLLMLCDAFAQYGRNFELELLEKDHIFLRDIKIETTDKNTLGINLFYEDCSKIQVEDNQKEWYRRYTDFFSNDRPLGKHITIRVYAPRDKKSKDEIIYHTSDLAI